MKTIGEYEASLHALKATNFAQKVLKEVDNDNKDTFAKHAKTNFLAGVEWLIEEMGWLKQEEFHYPKVINGCGLYQTMNKKKSYIGGKYHERRIQERPKSSFAEI